MIAKGTSTINKAFTIFYITFFDHCTNEYRLVMNTTDLFLTYRELIAPNNQTSRDLKFDAIEIQGGGSIEIQSDKEGLSITCTTLWIRSGAILTASRLSIACDSVTIEQSGVIDLNYKASFLIMSSLILFGCL